jgi:exportin-T
LNVANQPIFETVISTLEHFAKDGNDFPTAKMTFQVLSRMVTVWGGPDIADHLPGVPNGNPVGPEPQPVLPRFDQFIMTKFSPLVWAIPSTPSFNPKDGQAKQVLGEMATLHKTIYMKLGRIHLEWVGEKELGGMGGMGLNEKWVEEYVESLRKMDMKTFKIFFQVTIPFWLCNVVV